MRPGLHGSARVALSILVLAVSLAAGEGFAPEAAQAFPYVIEDLGVLPGETNCIPFAINARGQVVGSSGNRAFLFTDGAGMVELLPLPGATRAIARGINDDGVAVGESWGSVIPYHAVRWNGGAPTDLGAVGASSRAWDISPLGVVVGETPVDDLGSDAFLFADATGMDLLAPEHFASHAYDINEAGQVAGLMTVYNSYHAFRFTPGTGIQDLGVVGNFLQSGGQAVNISGQVAGNLTSATGNTQRLFRFTDGVGMIELGGLGETNEVEGMNSRGDFVGRGLPALGIERAFLYTDPGGLQDLERLIDTQLGWRLLYAFDINDAGQIVGLAWSNPLEAWRGYRLTPTTPVGPVAALSFSPARVEGSVVVTGWATLTQPAPAGGAVVALSSGDPQALAVPGSVSIPAGQRHGRFFATSMPVAGTTLVEVSATYDGGVQTRTLEVVPVVTGVGDGPDGAAVLRVHAPAPNPARASVTLRYELARPADVRLRIYDARGRLIRTLVESPQALGEHHAVWDGRDQAGLIAPPGLYFMRMEAAGIRYQGRLALLR